MLKYFLDPLIDHSRKKLTAYIIDFNKAQNIFGSRVDFIFFGDVDSPNYYCGGLGNADISEFANIYGVPPHDIVITRNVLAGIGAVFTMRPGGAIYFGVDINDPGIIELLEECFKKIYKLKNSIYCEMRNKKIPDIKSFIKKSLSSK